MNKTVAPTQKEAATSSGLAELEELETGLRALLMSPQPVFIEGLPKRGQEAYRELVRNSLLGNILRALPVAKNRLGTDNLRALAARFLDERGISTRLYRKIPMDFATWLLEAAEIDDGLLVHPALGELIAWEVLELDIMAALDAEPMLLTLSIATDATLIFDPSLRIAAYQFPVHTMPVTPAADAPLWPDASGPYLLVAWRIGERMHWRRVAPVIAQVLATAAGSGESLGHVLAELETTGVSIDHAFVRSQLIDLTHRGALLGFLPPDAS